MSGAGDGFLARWSQLKRAAALAQEAADAVPAVAPASQPPGDVVADLQALPVLPPPSEPADASSDGDLVALPRLDDLTANGDLSAFMAKGIPGPLRQAAMRRMWSLDPAIRDFVGLADYAWDWNAPGGVPGFIGPLLPVDDVGALLKQAIGAAMPEEDAPAAMAEHRLRPGGEEPVAEPASLTSAEAAEEPAPAAMPEVCPPPGAEGVARTEGPSRVTREISPSPGPLPLSLSPPERGDAHDHPKSLRPSSCEQAEDGSMEAALSAVRLTDPNDRDDDGSEADAVAVRGDPLPGPRASRRRHGGALPR